MKRKKWACAVLMGLLALGAETRTAWATADSTNNQASLTITILPNIDLGVSIDTNSVILDLGTLDLSMTTQTVRPATVTILGTLASDGSQTTGQELDLSLTFTGGWDLDTSPSVDTTDAETDMIAVYALFSDTSLSKAPTAGQFSSENGGFVSTAQRAGGAGGDGAQFEKAGGGALPGDGMDHKSAGDKAHLWMLLRLPSATTDSTAKTVTLTATAVNAT